MIMSALRYDRGFRRSASFFLQSRPRVRGFEEHVLPDIASISSHDRKGSHRPFAALASGLTLVFVCDVAPEDDDDFSKQFAACMEQFGA
jgi:hypothetical protein